MEMSPLVHPVSYECDYARERSRLTTFFRYLLAIPWLIVAWLYGIAAGFAVVIGWFALMFTARWPRGLYDFVAGFVRFAARVGSWVSLATDDFPPFGGGERADYPVRVSIPEPEERYSRSKTFFRFILAFPAFFMGSMMGSITSAGASASWFTIVFRGYQPAGVQRAITTGLTYTTRSLAYLLLLTEAYPPVETETTAASPPPAAPPPPIPPPAAPPPVIG